MALTPDRLAPVLVTSPSIRSGTTLLQRLLCSSPQAIIFGEEIGKDLEIALQVLASRQIVYTHSRARFEGSLRRVLAGDTGDWIPDLMPDLDDYLGALQAGAFAGLSACARQAAAAGRPLWGFKYPGMSPALIRLLTGFLPGTRVVYVHRGLAATARSAKAWGATGDDEGMQAFCAQWLAHRRFLRDGDVGAPVLDLAFEDLLDAPGATLARLEAFLGITGIDPGVLGLRINNLLEGVDTRHGRTGYLPPAGLDPREEDIVRATIAALG